MIPEFRDWLLTLIPLFVAIDALGVLPLFLSLTDGMQESSRRRLVREACLTALGVSLAFLFGGKWIFGVLGITDHDFRVGGGIVLLILAVTDLLFSPDTRRRTPESSVGIVPIGVPLIMGPAALTTLVILHESHGLAPALSSLAVNLLFVWIVFRHSSLVLKVMGKGGARAFSKVMSLILTAIAVRMIRVGLTGMLGAVP